MNANRHLKQTVALALGIAAMAVLPAKAGVGVGVQINVPVPPPPVVTVPAPSVSVAVPDDYVWDGSEYVGVVGSSYVYLGPGDVWLPLDGPRLDRWHTYVHAHGDWHSHAIHNDRYRAHGHEAPARDEHHDDHHDDHRDDHH